MQQYWDRFKLFMRCRDRDKRETICVLMDAIWFWFSSSKFLPFSSCFMGAKRKNRCISFHSFKFRDFSLLMFHLFVTTSYRRSAFSWHCLAYSKKRKRLGKVNVGKIHSTKKACRRSISQAQGLWRWLYLTGGTAGCSSRCYQKTPLSN